VRVLILGEGKSGTTALLRSVSQTLDDPTELFEPVRLRPADLKPDPLVIKKLLLNWRRAEARLTEDFDKLIFIQRDPRDRLISHLLYAAYNQGPSLDAEDRKRWVSVLEKKAANPKEIPLLDVLHDWWELTGHDMLSQYVRALDRTRRFLNHEGTGFFVIRYEQYVEGDLEELSTYLGLPLAAGVVKGAEERVVRSGSHGDWRLWFTPDDVKIFRPMTEAALAQQQYDAHDWELAPADSLDRATTVDYVQRLFDRQPISP